MNKPLGRFLAALTPDQQRLFAEWAGTSVGSLRHYVSGRRVPKAEVAIVLEEAAEKLRKLYVDPLPPLGRRDLSPACRGCKYAKACTRNLA